MNRAIVYIASACILALTSACASQQKPLTDTIEETPACMNYRAMMTAPMPPSEVQRLRVACEESRRQP